MKTRTLLLMMLACLPLISFAQNDDDMYFVPKKSKTSQTTQSAPSVPARQSYTPQRTQTDEYYTGTLRDVDEYNRRGTNGVTSTPEYSDENKKDTVYVVVENQNEDYEDCLLSARLARFHGYGYPYYAWYDPWYDPWYYDPWYYRPGWGWSGYWSFGGWGWRYSWYDPWYYGPTWGWSGYYGGYAWGHYHHHATAGGGTPHRGFNGGRGYAMSSSPRGSMGASRNSNGRSTRTGRAGSTAIASSRGYVIGNRSERGASRGMSGGTRGMIGASRGTGNSTVRGITGSSSRSTVNNSSRSTSSYRGTSSTSSYSGSSRSSSSSTRGSSGSTFSGSSRSSGGFSGGGSRGGGFSGGGSRGGGGRR